MGRHRSILARIFFSKIRRNVSSRATDRSRRIKQLAIFVSRLTVLTGAAFNQRRQAFKINEYARVCWTRVRSVAINYVSETKNYLEKYFTLSALRTLIKYIVRPIVPFPCALIMGHAKTKQQYADKVSLERLPNDRFSTAREERKEAISVKSFQPSTNPHESPSIEESAIDRWDDAVSPKR